MPQCWVEKQAKVGGAIGEWRVKATPGLLMSDVRGGIDAITDRHKENPRLITIDPLPQVCDDANCYLVKNGQANFSDTLHVSNVNVSQYNKIFEEAIESALKSGLAAKKFAD